MMPEQRRARSIAMNADEVNSFLAGQRTCRLATLGSGGPHVSPVWFVWDSVALWVYSLNRSQRWTDIARDPPGGWLRITPRKVTSWDFRKLAGLSREA
jgi:nitroimidazol reductase NimA-like FMN-containing flavoprotein (pyridoxamine 5'-phosphate oxidase superfamily)